MNKLKREDLPPFKKLSYTFDVQEILKSIENIPDIVDDLKVKNGYGDLVGGKSPILEKAFGLKFKTIEDAYNWLQLNDVAESELTKGLNNKKMSWDFRNYIKPFEKYIVKENEDTYKVIGSPYKQIALTEYNLEMEKRIYDKKIPKNRLDERHYNKIVDWAKGTYLEKILKSFKAEHTRARIAIMDPGAYVNEHIDYNTDYSIRYHIPITTNDDCGFYVIDTTGQKHFQKMNPGECWFLNQGLRHAAWNKGTTPRSHLIISFLTQEDLYA